MCFFERAPWENFELNGLANMNIFKNKTQMMKTYLASSIAFHRVFVTVLFDCDTTRLDHIMLFFTCDHFY